MGLYHSRFGSNHYSWKTIIGEPMEEICGKWNHSLIGGEPMFEMAPSYSSTWSSDASIHSRKNDDLLPSIYVAFIGGVGLFEVSFWYKNYCLYQSRRTLCCICSRCVD